MYTVFDACELELVEVFEVTILQYDRQKTDMALVSRKQAELLVDFSKKKKVLVGDNVKKWSIGKN